MKSDAQRLFRQLAGMRQFAKYLYGVPGCSQKTYDLVNAARDSLYEDIRLANCDQALAPKKSKETREAWKKLTTPHKTLLDFACARCRDHGVTPVGALCYCAAGKAKQKTENDMVRANCESLPRSVQLGQPPEGK